MAVKVRMAPSPTGFLHIGGVRTFLFNWLFARGRGGECLLRIENTDTSREVAESVEQIQRSLTWLGIEWDGPDTFQLDRWNAAARRRGGSSQRARRTRTRARSGSACPTRARRGGRTPSRVRIEFPNERLEDLVLVRSDGRPTYNFASPVEDRLDGITHVIRGDDHVSNTPKQIVDPARARRRPPGVRARAERARADGKKLSKRHGAQSGGRVPRGGLHRGGAHELPRAARLELRRPDDDHGARRAGRALHARARRPSPATFDYAKLEWMNGVYLRALPPEEYARAAGRVPARAGLDWDEDTRAEAAPLVQEKIAHARASSRSSPGSSSTRSSRTRRPSTAASSQPRARRSSGVDRSTPRRSRRRCAARRGLGLKPRQAFPPIRVAVTGRGLTRPVREPRAARPGRVARPAPAARA